MTKHTMSPGLRVKRSSSALVGYETEWDALGPEKSTAVQERRKRQKMRFADDGDGDDE
jgi:hypothetical protein